MNHKTHSALVYDNGLFVEIAVTLAADFGKVYYYSPWQSAFPKSNSTLIGKGIPGVERVDDIWGHVDDIDLFVFPDVYDGELQLFLSNNGKRVWGSRMGEELELLRAESKEHLKALGLWVGNYRVIKGLGSLREHLKGHKNQWVKISCTRGDMETFHSKNYKNIEPRLDELEHVLGAKKAIMEFIVEDAIEDAVEIGYDGYCVDGVFPLSACVGLEIKDKGYIGRFLPSANMPKQITQTNAAIAPTLKEFGYRNFFAMEARITRSGTPWIIDPCARFGSPPGELLQLMYKNLSDILWHGAGGVCIDPEPLGKWGAELLIHSEWADRNWQSIQFPPSLRPHIKLRNLTILGGEYYVVPQSYGLPEIGAVVVVGDTLEEAIETVKEYAKQVEGYFIEVFPESLDEARGELEKLAEFGVTL